MYMYTYKYMRVALSPLTAGGAVFLRVRVPNLTGTTVSPYFGKPLIQGCAQPRLRFLLQLFQSLFGNNVAIVGLAAIACVLSISVANGLSQSRWADT